MRDVDIKSPLKFSAGPQLRKESESSGVGGTVHIIYRDLIVQLGDINHTIISFNDTFILSGAAAVANS